MRPVDLPRRPVAVRTFGGEKKEVEEVRQQQQKLKKAVVSEAPRPRPRNKEATAAAAAATAATYVNQEMVAAASTVASPPKPLQPPSKSKVPVDVVGRKLPKQLEKGEPNQVL